MILRFSSGSRDAVERRREKLVRIDVDERNIVVAAEQADDLLGLALAQQAVVDEDAGQLVADRLVDQHGRDRRIDAAGQAADDPPLPTCARIAATASCAEGAPSTSRPSAPAILWTKFASSRAPSGVCTTSGWNCTP